MKKTILFLAVIVSVSYSNALNAQSVIKIPFEQPAPCDNSGIAVIDDISVDIFPNPTDGILNIRSAQLDELEKISLYSVDGKIGYSTKGTSSINIAHLPKGFYFLRLQFKEKSITKAILLQ